ncbi:MAG TPA: hypothetical protein VFF73_41520 [Planctomycetota bacterium]|nr:hypothetical protein [Planctomycetota bacterium]
MNDANPPPSGLDRALGILFILLGFALIGAVAGALFLLGLSSIGRGSGRYNVRASDLATALMILAQLDAATLVALGWRCARHPSVARRRSRYGLAAALLLVAAATAVVWFVRIEGPSTWSGQAIGAVTHISTAEVVYRERGKEVCVYGTLEQLVAAGLIQGELGTGRTPGYSYTVMLSTKAPELDWCVVATPDDPQHFEFFYRGSRGGLLVGTKPPRIDPETCLADDSFTLPAGSGLK